MIKAKRFSFKRLYFPGLISLAVFPMLCISSLYLDGKFIKLYYIKLIWWDKPALDQSNKRWHNQGPDFTTFRKYTEIVMKGTEGDNQLTLKKITALVKQLSRRDDFSTGVKVLFTNQSTFNDLMSTLDLANIYPNINCFLYNDEIYFWKFNQPVPKLEAAPRLPPPLTYGYAYLNEQPALPFFDDLYLKITSNLKLIAPFWPSGLALIAMLFFWKRRSKVGSSSTKNSPPY